MSENEAMEDAQQPISDEEAQDVDDWTPPSDGEKPASTLEAFEVRRLLLALETALRDCRQASREVKSLLPAMNAVAQNIEKAAQSPLRLALAAGGGALVGAMALWILQGGAL